MLTHGWVPLDEGTIGLAARYVNGGAIPHRDFTYPYTGALPYLHALAQRVLGDSLVPPRLTLFFAFALWLPAVWSLARAFVPPATAAAAVVLAAWWSLLIYPAAMPTWYLLFLATWVLVALQRWHNTQRTRWLLAAGLCAGIALTIKQTGVFTLVGGGLAVLAFHQASARAQSESEVAPLRRADAVVLSLLAIAACVPVLLIAQRGLLSGDTLMLALPLLAVLGVLANRERELHADVRASRRRLFVAWGHLLGGALVAPAILVAFYASNDALPALVNAMAGATVSTLGFIDHPIGFAPLILAYGVPVGVVMAVVGRVATSGARAVAGVAIACLLAVLAMYFVWAYRAIWNFALLLLPVTVGAAMQLERRAARAGRASDPLSLALAATIAMHALNQFPFAAPNYYGYVAPLVLLLGVIVAAEAGVTQQLRGVVALLLVFGGWFHRIGNVGTVGFASIWWDDAHVIAGPYGGLLVSRTDSARYARVTALIGEHGGSEAFVAGPELSVLYTLAGTRRVVAQPYLLLADARADVAAAAMADSGAIAASTEIARARLVAINDTPLFVSRVKPSVRAWIVQRFPHSERVDHIEVRWR